MMSRLGFKSAGNHCCAFGCAHKSSSSKCSFLSFPTDPKWNKIWVLAINRQFVDESGRPVPGKLWQPSKHHRLCTCHFSQPPNPKRKTKGWNHFKPDVLSSSKKENTPRKTLKARNRLPLKPDKIATASSLTSENKSTTRDDKYEEHTELHEESTCGHAHITNDSVCHDHDYLQTERKGRVVEAVDKLAATNEEFQDLLEEHTKATSLLDRYQQMERKGQIFSFENIKLNDSLFCYYTGFPSYQVFLAVYEYLYPKAVDMQYVSQYGHAHHTDRFQRKPGKTRVLSLEEEMFATLVRLRLGLPSKDCSRRFGIAESTFSNIFNTWVILLAKELEEICSMPPTEVTLQNQAPCFDPFSNVRIVLDCTEVFTQTPGSLSNHRQIYSNYKHHSTAKFLVGMSPSGAIIYVSDMWGGRASDKKITQECTDLLDALDAGNKVMVDRGFTISEDLPPGVKLIIPPFKDKRTGQLSAQQLEYSEKISVARIHVERAMRAIKEYRLLEVEIKMALINNFENIFKACAFLVNFKNPFLKVRP